MKYLNLFFQNAQLQVKGFNFKEQNVKNRIGRSSFFNAISLEYKATKLPKDYMEREESQTCLAESLKVQETRPTNYGDCLPQLVT